jgi:hypothetical protein
VFGFLQGILDAIGSFGNVIIDGISTAVNAIGSLLMTIFSPVLDLIMGIGYLISHLLQIILLILQLVLGLFVTVATLISSIYSVLAGINYAGSAGSTLNSQYTREFNFVFDFLNTWGFGTFALVANFFIVIGIAKLVIRAATYENA